MDLKLLITLPTPGASAATALAAANLFISLGLKSAGYIYVNTDDTWSQKSRVNGLLVPDSSKWPNGIKSVTDTLHGMGLKYGLYGDSGTQTCSGYPGSQGYETVDANTIAGWGVDLWKYDNVRNNLLVLFLYFRGKVFGSYR